jgi:hypothetical protein
MYQFKSVNLSSITINQSFISYSSFIYHLFITPNPASSPAGRAPPYGGIARPKGSPYKARTAAITGCSACPLLIFSKNRDRIHIGNDSQRDENPAGFRPPPQQGHSVIRGCSACLPLIFGQNRDRGFTSEMIHKGMKTQRVFAPRRGLLPAAH